MKKNLIFPLLLLFVVLSCSSKASKEEAMIEDSYTSSKVVSYDRPPSPVRSSIKFVPPVIKRDEEVSVETTDIEKKITKNGELEFETKNPVKTTAFIKSFVQKYKANIMSESSNLDDSHTNYTLSIEVPAEKFDSLIEDIEKYKDLIAIESKNITIEDVTSEFIDVATRLRIKKASEQRLMSLLSQAKNLQDILDIEEKLANLRSEIESSEGRQKYLNQQVKYSTLDLSYYEKGEKAHAQNPFIGAIKHGWDLFINLIIGILNLWLIIIVSTAAFWGIRKFFKRRKAKKATVKE